MAFARLTTQSIGIATVEEWAKLDLNAPNSRVLRVTRIQRDDHKRPVALEEVILPLERFPRLSPNGSDIPDIIELGRRHGLSVGRASERVSIIPATEDVASHLGIATWTNVLKQDRVVETIDGEPVEWRVAYRKILNCGATAHSKKSAAELRRHDALPCGLPKQFETLQATTKITSATMASPPQQAQCHQLTIVSRARSGPRVSRVGVCSSRYSLLS